MPETDDNNLGLSPFRNKDKACPKGQKLLFADHQKSLMQKRQKWFQNTNNECQQTLDMISS
jgi:hypothetical protein